MAKENNQADETLIVKIALTEIDVDQAWNARSPWEKGDTDKTGHGFGEMVKSFKEKGQIRPCDVTKSKGGRFLLRTGFRRHAAATAAEIPFLLAVVRNWTESEAREHNLTENVRDDLRSSDTCWAIGKYLATVGWAPGQELTALKVPQNQESIGDKFGLSQSYVSKHMQVLNKVKPEIIEAWRNGLPLGVESGPRQDVGVLKFMSVAQVDPERQAEQWALLLGIGPDGKKKEKDPLEKAKGEAKKVGALLGRLALAEVVEITGAFAGDLELFVPSASGLARSNKEIVAGVLALSFETAKTEGSQESEKEGGEAAESN